MLEEKMNEHEDYNSAIIWIITCNPAQEYQQIIDLHKRRGESMTMFTTECKVLTLIWMILVLKCWKLLSLGNYYHCFYDRWTCFGLKYTNVIQLFCRNVGSK